MRVGRALLLALVWVAVGCSSKPQEEKSVASSAAPLVVEGWAGTGPMAEARKYHAGVVLQSGKALVMGGYNASGYLSSATVYEPGTGSWTAVAPMPEARQGHAATLLETGKVLVAGGENATGRLASASVYDPATNTWATAGTFASGVARDAMTATRLLSGKVLVAGGGNNAGAHSKVDVYDPVAGTWSLAASMGTARRNHTATLLASGKVLVVGGRGSTSLATAELYEPGSNQWTGTGGMGTARYNHTATRLASGKVLVVGGRNSSTGVVGTAEEYDPGTGTWSPTNNVPGNARELHTATLLSTGKVLVVGGQNGSALASAEVYDPETRTWSTTTPAMGGARYVHVAVSLEAQGKVLVVGGVGANGASQATAEVYVYDACAGVICNSAPGQCYEAAGTCSGGACSYALKAAGAACDDGEACTGTDVCNGAGVCAGSATSCSSPPGQCYEAAGTCSGGGCSYAYKADGAGCDDGDACTVGEVCNGAGGCAGTPVSCSSPPGQCYEAAGTCSGGACSYAPKAAGTACDDGNGGTINDVCSGAGVCAGVVACTMPPDACHGSPGTYSNGACSYPVKAGGTACGAGQICNATGQCVSGCWIGGTGYAAGATNPGTACQECNPSVSTSSWSNKAVGTTCGDPAYGAWGGCGGFSDTCDETGSQSRTATAYACTSSGTCAGSNSSETQACTRSTGGTACGTSYGGWGSCGGFSDYCDTTGTQSRTVTASTCGAGTCNVSNTSTETQACTRAAPDTSCAAPSYGAWSACSFSDTCAQTGTQSRTVTSYGYSCASGQCVASTSTETQSCTRNTNGNSCGATSYGSWGSCGGYSDTCDESGTQSRSATSYTCSNGTCGSSTGTDSQPCSRSTTGTACGTSYGGWGSCGFGDYCTTTGTQSRSVTSSTCGGGTCNATSSSSETQSCTRPPPNTYCGATSYGGWSSCDYGDICAETGTKWRTVTDHDFNCSTGQCESSTYEDSQSCSRNTDGTSCGGVVATEWSYCWAMGDFCSSVGEQYRGAWYPTCGSGTCEYGPDHLETRACSRTPLQCPGGASYGPWSACSFGDACTTTGTQSRTVTSQVANCSTGNCETSTSTETQTCTRAPPQVQCPGTSYGAWGSCSGTDACGQGGSRSRTVTSYSASDCQCVASTTTETETCPTDTSSPYMACGNMCVDTSSDFNNCGSCGNRCPNYKFDCIEGVCEYM